jgi:hypothetical protein
MVLLRFSTAADADVEVSAATVGAVQAVGGYCRACVKSIPIRSFAADTAHPGLLRYALPAAGTKNPVGESTPAGAR